MSLKWTLDRKITHSLKADSIRAEVDASRKRLRTEALDLVQVHWPEPDADIEEGWRTLAELKDRGLVRHIGVSNFNVAQMERASSIAPVETLQPPYSLVVPEVEDEILPYAQAHGVGVIVYSPMGCGLLSGAMTAERVARMPADDWRRRDGDFREPRLSRHLALARLLGEIGKRHGGRSAAEVAVAWTLANPAVTGAIVGGRSRSRSMASWERWTCGSAARTWPRSTPSGRPIPSRGLSVSPRAGPASPSTSARAVVRAKL